VDFGLPEELKMIQSLVKDFVTDQLKPLERELLGRAAGLADARRSLPPEVDEKLMGMAMELGLWGLSVPEELGGVGLGTLGCCLAEEELAQTIVPFTFGDVSPMLFECSEGQREKYFLPLFNRRKESYIALMEPGEPASYADMQTRAEKSNGKYIINGRKLSFSVPARDEYFAMVYSRTSGGTGDGVTCFLVDGGTPGFSLGQGAAETGWRSQVRAPTALIFNDCAVPAEAVLGGEGRAFHLGRKWLPSRRIVRGARSVGVAQRLLEEASTQAQSWQSFGQFVSRRLDIESALADMAADIHACRLVVHEAACKSDEGQLTRRGAAVVKVFASEMLGRVADRVSHVFNGPPYLEGLPMEKLCRNVLATRSLGLAMELQRSIIARDILKGLKV
jgi:alkylation response protein AidB-like acyl-CoA dehydrogenase